MTGSGTMNSHVHHGAGLLGRLASWLAAFRRRSISVRPEPPDQATREALRDSEERLRLVRRATGLGMYEIDWLERRRYWSPELRAILRVSPDHDIDTDTDLLERIIPNDMRMQFREKLRGSLSPEGNGDYEDEHRITRFDGTTGWILLRGKTFFQDSAAGKRPTPSLGLVVDITDRRRAEEAKAFHAPTVLSSTHPDFSIDPDPKNRTRNGGARRPYCQPGGRRDGPP